MSVSPHHRRKRRRRRVLIAVGLSFAVVLTVLLVLGVMVRSTPGWWRAVSTSDAASKASGEQLENSVVSELSRARPKNSSAQGPWRSEPWTVALSADQANAWLNNRLPQWLINRDLDQYWPSSIEQVQTAFRDGQILVGMRVRIGASTQVVSFDLTPSIGDSGALSLRADRIAIGRLPVPLSAILAAMPADQAASIGGVLRGTRPVADDAVIHLDDGRRVRLLRLEPRGDDLEITCVTEAGG